jgi:hypothetical protein
MMTRQEFAAFMGVSLKTVDLYRKLGLLASVKVRGIIRFPAPYVTDFFRRHLEPSLV